MEWTKEIIKEIEDLYKEHGEPEIGSDPSTETNGFRLATPEDIGDWNGEEEKASQFYNDDIDKVYRLIDINWTGLTTFHTSYYSSPEFDSFQEKARKIIEDWLENSFELFCNDNQVLKLLGVNE